MVRRIAYFTVNCVGVMGKGIALQFKRAYPRMFVAYQEACRRGDVRIGSMWVWEDGPVLIVNFPTKVDWREDSRLSYIKRGLAAMVQEIRSRSIGSIAIRRQQGAEMAGWIGA